jgi:hypothetical protein
MKHMECIVGQRKHGWRKMDYQNRRIIGGKKVIQSYGLYGPCSKCKKEFWCNAHCAYKRNDCVGPCCSKPEVNDVCWKEVKTK